MGADEKGVDKMKYCPECMKTKPEGLFGKDATRKDGLNIYCKTCVKGMQIERYTMTKTERQNWLDHYKRRYWERGL